MNEVYNKLPIPTEHSSAFVDLDADCQNDLVIHSRISKWDNSTNSTKQIDYIEIWRGIEEKDGMSYCLTSDSVYTLDEKLGPFTISDVNRDGLLDLVFPITSGSKGINVLIALNKINLNLSPSNFNC